MTPQKICQDESLFDFVSRRLGNDVAKYAIDPFVRGICAGDARKISAKGVRRVHLFLIFCEINYTKFFVKLISRLRVIIPREEQGIKENRQGKQGIY